MKIPWKIVLATGESDSDAESHTMDLIIEAGRSKLKDALARYVHSDE